MAIVANPIAQTIFDKVIIASSCRKSLNFKDKGHSGKRACVERKPN